MKKQLLPDKVESLWIGTTPETDFPKLEREIKVDVAIIGGGIAGLNAAYFLKSKGLKVAVIEATYIASGTSGNTTAKITSQHGLKYAYLKKTFGRENAKIYADSNQWAIEEVKRIIKKEQIKCDFHILPAYVYAKTKPKVEEIAEEVKVAKELSLPVTFEPVVKSVPFKIYGLIKFNNQAYFHPRKYLLSLANKINKDGSYIFEKTEALDIKEGRDSCEVITDEKSINAKFVIVATNAPFYGKDFFSSQLTQIRSYVLAVRLNSKTPLGMFIGAGEEGLSFRPHVSGENKWLTIGGIHHFAKSLEDANLHYEKLAKEARNNFDIKNIDYKWAAEDSYSLDKVPFIGKMPESERVLVTTGFNAWGMTTSFVSAKILTDLIVGNKNDWVNFYSPSRIKLK